MCVPRMFVASYATALLQSLRGVLQENTVHAIRLLRKLVELRNTSENDKDNAMEWESWTKHAEVRDGCVAVTCTRRRQLRSFCRTLVCVWMSPQAIRSAQDELASFGLVRALVRHVGLSKSAAVVNEALLALISLLFGGNEKVCP
jgi:hypothetical protein